MDMSWLYSLLAAGVCLAAGVAAVVRSPHKRAATLFVLAMACAFVALITGSSYALVPQAERDVADTLVKVFVISGLLATVFVWQTSIVFPLERRPVFSPPNALAVTIVASVIACVIAGSLAEVEYTAGSDPAVSDLGYWLLVGGGAVMVAVSVLVVLATSIGAGAGAVRSGQLFAVGMVVFVATALPALVDPGEVTRALMLAGIAATSLTIACSISWCSVASITVSAAPEAFTSTTKSTYRLLPKHVYLIEEPRPDFTFKVFNEVLKSRCYDCENADSFPCESLACTTCSLPCPCRSCSKYSSRAHGIVVTRQFPREVRTRYFLQTTPIVWLSTLPGKENLDPAKLNVLTDMLVSFMERSTNGVLMVDGIEYLVTNNDFARVLKAVDRWTEAAMTSSSRLIISIDPRAFEGKELALLERDKEVVSPAEGDVSGILTGPAQGRP